MSIYIDLTLLSLFFNSLVSLYFVKVLSLKKIKIFSFILSGLLNCAQLVFIYQNFYLSLILYLLISLLLFLKFFKKEGIFYLMIYLFFSYASQFMIFLVLHGLTFYRGVFIISEKNQIFSLIAYPAIMIIIFVVSIFVDKCYRLRSFKEGVFLIIDEKKYFLEGYMDSGNMLMHKNTPVVFIKDNLLKENVIFNEKIEVSSINGSSLFYGKKALLSLGSQKTYHYIYLCLTKENNNFNGCECLLNINLIY